MTDKNLGLYRINCTRLAHREIKKYDFVMIDKKELDEITQYAKNFDNHHVSTQWDNWKMDLREELDRVCKTEDELDEIMSVILKQNLSEVAKNLFEGAAEDLTNEKYENEEWAMKK